MPTLKKYVNKEGYYINARPSDAGNVTYQVDPSIWDFLEELGYSHESDIEWDLIKPFRAAGLIYTAGEGPSVGDDAFEPDSSKLSELPDETIQAILDYLESRNDINPRIKDQIRERIFGHEGDGSATLIVGLEDRISERIQQCDMRPWETKSIEVEVDQNGDDREITLSIYSRKTSSDLLVSFVYPEVSHTVTVVERRDGNNIVDWETNVDRSLSWNDTVTALEYKTKLANLLGDALSEFDISMGKTLHIP